MADENCSAPPAPRPAAAKPGQRMVKCVKFGKDMPGLDYIPWNGALGQRVFDNVSEEAWKMWVEHSKMIMNEYRLNPGIIFKIHASFDTRSLLDVLYPARRTKNLVPRRSSPSSFSR